MDHKREHRTPPPLARVMGVGRQQQHAELVQSECSGGTADTYTFRYVVNEIDFRLISLSTNMVSRE